MDKEQCLAICRERLENWSQKMAGSLATPLLLVGMGQGKAKGQLVICTLDEREMNKATILGLLRRALTDVANSEEI